MSYEQIVRLMGIRLWQEMGVLQCCWLHEERLEKYAACAVRPRISSGKMSGVVCFHARPKGLWLEMEGQYSVVAREYAMRQ
jgi:hypothetical protein